MKRYVITTKHVTWRKYTVEAPGMTAALGSARSALAHPLFFDTVDDSAEEIVGIQEEFALEEDSQ